MMHGFGFGGCCGLGGFGAFGSLGWIGWILNLVITLGVVIGIIVLVIWAVRRLTGGQRGSFVTSSQGQTAREILQNRYARGEITRDEYQHMLADIS
ncbi:MAG TPA: SHOCT domain-containing protein [Anaerolineales bacterium]